MLRFLVFLAWPVAALAEPVPATIAQDAVWTAAGNPWQVQGDVVVEATLRVEPGVVVAFSGGANLVVEGILVARGAPDDPILFTSSDGEARWGSIRFTDASADAVYEGVDSWVSGSILEHAVVERGSRAVHLQGASPLVRDTVFRDNAYTPNLAVGGAAMLIEDGSTARVVGCTFEDNQVGGTGQGGAVFVEDANPVLQGNVFRRNTSTYGGALTTNLMWSPIVGNTFEDNHSSWEGGGMALVSTSSAVLDNTVVGNSTVLDGGGIHVCVTCYPHAFPFVMDNVITGNSNVAHGAAGIGSAHLRTFTDNDVHDNLQGEAPADFAWHNEEEGVAPPWVMDPVVSGNWWGTTDIGAVMDTIEDGRDVEGVGVARFLPLADGPVAAPTTRATITTMKYRYSADGEPMPVFLTVYNPGRARDVELMVLLQYGDGPAVPWRGELPFPGAEPVGDGWRLTLPTDSVWWVELARAPWRDEPSFPDGAWHVALFDAGSGQPLGDPISARFELQGVP